MRGPFAPDTPMPAADRQTFTLQNGLRVQLCHAPRLRRAAAAVWVEAGSHDVPARWPGLAHFLEHLFFLGTERFPTGDHLMAHVQRHGGQVNASTRERCTEFFFEVPPNALEAGVERLCDMLAAPRLAMDEQLREREVLHAEFIAWLRNTEAQASFQALAVLPWDHPLRGFHAGNRYSLRVPDPAFQSALRAFHAHFYQAGQITLSLAGPQPLETLSQLAERYGAGLPQGSTVQRTAPPALFFAEDTIGGVPPSKRLLLSDNSPDDGLEAARFVCHGLNSRHPGGLAQTLLAHGLAASLTAQVVYAFEGQSLIELTLEHPADASGIDLLLRDWLGFFHDQWPALFEGYQAQEARRLERLSALETARRHAEGAVPLRPESVRRMLDRLTLAAPFSARTAPRAEWRLPAPNPLLGALPTLPRRETFLPGLRAYSDQCGSGDASLHLRWHTGSAQRQAGRAIEQRVAPLIEQAHQAGVTLWFHGTAGQWLLQMQGSANVLPHVLQRALALIDQGALTDQAAIDARAPIPIRQLLQALPDHLTAETPIVGPMQWHALAQGFDEERARVLRALLAQAPGQGTDRLEAPMPLEAGRHWRYVPSTSSEHALLVFCPTPGRDTAQDVRHEAEWRLLAHLLQSLFYQRMRVELQLGYAVFSAFRQVDGHSGIVFGVQSPGATVKTILGHLQHFLAELPGLISEVDVPTQRQSLADQLNRETMEPAQAAELLWNAHLAGHGSEYVERLRQAVLAVSSARLQEALRQLASAETGWLCLANQPVAIQA